MTTPAETIMPHGTEPGPTNRWLAAITLLLLAAVMAYTHRIDERGWYEDDYILAHNANNSSFNEFVHELTLTKGLAPALMYYYYLYRSQPLVSHLFNLMIHLTNIFLIALLARRLLGTTGGCISALVFALHPQSSNAIFWTCCSPYLLATTSALTAGLLVLFYYRSQRKDILILCILVLICGLLLSPQLVFMTPLIALLPVRWRDYLSRPVLLAVVAFGSSSIIWFGLRLLFPPSDSVRHIVLDNMYLKILTQAADSILRAISPGVRSVLLPIARGETQVPTEDILLWALVSIAAFTSFTIGFMRRKLPDELTSEAPEKPQFLGIALKGILLFWAAYMVGAFSSHPYLAKRFFYLASIGLALAVGSAGAWWLVPRRLPRQLQTGALFLGVGAFLAAATPTIMAQSNEFASVSIIMQQVEDRISKEEQQRAGKFNHIFVLGIPTGGFSTRPKTWKQQIPFGMVPTSNDLVLVRANNDLYRIATIRYNTGYEKTTLISLEESSDVKRELTLRHLGVIPSAGRMRLLKTGEMDLAEMQVTLVNGIQISILFLFKTDQPILLDRVYPRVDLIHRDGTRTTIHADRTPAGLDRKNDLYHRNLAALLTNNEPVHKILLTFTTVAADPGLATIEDIAPQYKLKNNQVIIPINVLP